MDLQASSVVVFSHRDAAVRLFTIHIMFVLLCLVYS